MLINLRVGNCFEIDWPFLPLVSNALFLAFREAELDCFDQVGAFDYFRGREKHFVGINYGL
jgi:hypothetical protein